MLVRALTFVRASIATAFSTTRCFLTSQSGELPVGGCGTVLAESLDQDG